MLASPFLFDFITCSAALKKFDPRLPLPYIASHCMLALGLRPLDILFLSQIGSLAETSGLYLRWGPRIRSYLVSEIHGHGEGERNFIWQQRLGWRFSETPGHISGAKGNRVPTIVRLISFPLEWTTWGLLELFSQAGSISNLPLASISAT